MYTPTILKFSNYLPTKMEQTECSETSAYKIQTPGNYPKENIQRTKSTQILPYADDVAIMSRSKNALKDTFSNIEKEARRRGLLVNENKTKYMQVARAVHNDEHLCCGQHKFEHVKEISYLGSQMNQTNSISSEIQARILGGN